jgi:cellulose synthase/poly-beta-1,6-N-acetylglucosamine synthase-like glycosyltransferase
MMTHGIAYPWDLVVFIIEIALFAYFLLVTSFYAFAVVVALLRLPWFVKLHRSDPLLRSQSSLDQPVSMIVPAYNEEKAIVATVRSLLAIEYAASEVIVVNDGSTDRTLDMLAKSFALEPSPDVRRVVLRTGEVKQIYRSATYPALRVVDKANGGKADALNAGINISRYPLVLSCDADSYYHPSALEWLTEPFQKDPRTVVVGGAIGVGNDCIPDSKDATFEPSLPKGMLQRFQALEYLRAFLATRVGWAPFNALGIISGACGLWSKDVLVEVGGYRTDTVWEDMEMTLRVHHFMRVKRRPYRVAFTPYPVCWTIVPETAGELFHQRKYWHRHLSECIAIHRNTLWSNGTFGWMTMPYFVLAEWLAPLAVAVGFAFALVGIYFHFLDWFSQGVLLALVIVLALLHSFLALLLDEMSFTAYGVRDVWSLFGTALIEQVGYRQFIWLANLSGFFAWLFRRPYRGRKPPGPFVRPYDPDKSVTSV